MLSGWGKVQKKDLSQLRFLVVSLDKRFVTTQIKSFTPKA